MYEDHPESDKKKLLESISLIFIAIVLVLTVVFGGYDTLNKKHYIDLEFFVIAAVSILFSVFVAWVGFKRLAPSAYIITNKGIEVKSPFRRFNVPYEIIEDVAIEPEGPKTYHYMVGRIILDLTSKFGKSVVIQTPVMDIYLSPTNPDEFKKEIEKHWNPENIVDYVPSRSITPGDSVRSLFLYTFFKVPFGELLLWIPISLILISFNLTLYQTYVIVAALIAASYILICFYSDRLVTTLTDSTPISDSKILDTVENLARKANIPAPRVDIADSLLKGMNAMVSGPYPSRSRIILTQEILKLSEDQRTAIIAHEISHIKNRDVLVSFVIGISTFLTWSYLWFTEIIPWSLGLLAVVAYFLISSFVFGFILRAVELRADLDSLSFYDSPEAFASALESFGKDIAKQTNSLLLVFGPMNKAKTIDDVESTVGLKRPARKMKRLWLWLRSHPPLYYRLKMISRGQKREGFLRIFFRTTRDFFRELIL
jgi:heat shock protein HtpX